jgi:hypothetical protein
VKRRITGDRLLRDEDRAGDIAQDALGGVAEEQLSQTTSAMRSHANEARVAFLDDLDDDVVCVTDLDEDILDDVFGAKRLDHLL